MTSTPSPPSAHPKRPRAGTSGTGPAAPPPGQPVFVPATPHDIFGMLYVPPPKRAIRTPILLCGPFGWEDVTAHRSLRTWAQRLAGQGHPTLRIDLPGTGDSGGHPQDLGLVSAWITGIAAAASWLAKTGGSPTITLLGIGLPGLLALHATPYATAIGDLVLWGVPSRGRAAVRQLQAFARMERESAAIDANGEPLADVPTPEDGRLAPGGFLVSHDTQDALRGIDLTTTVLPPQPRRRVLLLERDGLPADGRLRSHLEDSGVDVTAAPGGGYGQMTDHPQTTIAPAEAMRSVDAWLQDAPAPSTTGTNFPRFTGPAEMLVNGVRETPLVAAPGGGPQTFGILTMPVDEPTRGLTVVFLNAGAMRRIGPNRMWVEAARRWASAGIPCVRLDVGGLGDAPGPTVSPITNEALHHPDSVDHLVATLDLLEERGLPGRFVLVGLCAGSWLAFTIAGRDARVQGALLFNPRALIWGPHLTDDRDARVAKRIVRRSQWVRVLRGEVAPTRVLTILKAALRYPAGVLHRRRGRRRLAAALQHLDGSGVRVTFAFTDNEPMHDELLRDGHLARFARSPHLHLVTVSGRDHTMRPLDEQAHGHAVLDAELTRLLSTLGRG